MTDLPQASKSAPPHLQSSFVKLFGDYPAVKVMDFLVTYREFDYPLTEIAEKSGIAWSTIHTFFPNLLRLGLVKQTRQVGRAKLYKLDTDNLMVKELISLDHRLIHALAEEVAGKAFENRNVEPPVHQSV